MRHESFRKICPKLVEEYEIVKIKTIDRIPYIEAKKKYASTQPIPSNSKTYSSTVSKNNQLQNKEIPITKQHHNSSKQKLNNQINTPQEIQSDSSTSSQIILRRNYEKKTYKRNK